MTKTIQAALSLLFIVSSLCGLSLLEYSSGRSISYLIVSCLYFSTIWSLYACLFYYLLYINRVTFVNQDLSLKINMLIAILSILLNLYHFKQLKTCLCKLSILDDTLEMLGIPKEYQRLYNWTIRIIIVWIVIVCFLNILDSLWMNYDYFSIARVFFPFVGSYLQHINSFNNLMWGTILRYVGSRYQRINIFIHSLLEHNTRHTRKRNKLVNQQRIKVEERPLYMWTLMHVHLQLCLISRELNKVFSTQMALQMASYFTFFVDMSCLVYTRYVNRNTATFRQILDSNFMFIWATVFSVRLFVLNHTCQTVCDKANETIAILYKFFNDSLNEDLRRQVLQFILQIKQRKLQFSGMGLFCFGHNLIRRFYASVVTIVVIIIQMDIAYTNIDVIPPISDEN